MGMVEKWDPVQGLQYPQDPHDPWDPKTPSTSGSHEPPGPPRPLDPQTLWDLKTLGKLPLPFEIQNLNTQKL